MSFHTKLIDLLKTDPRLVDDEGELLIAAAQDRAWLGEIADKFSATWRAKQLEYTWLRSRMHRKPD